MTIDEVARALGVSVAVLNDDESPLRRRLQPARSQADGRRLVWCPVAVEALAAELSEVRRQRADARRLRTARTVQQSS